MTDGPANDDRPLAIDASVGAARVEIFLNEISIVLECDDETTADRIYDKLSDLVRQRKSVTLRF